MPEFHVPHLPTEAEARQMAYFDQFRAALAIDMYLLAEAKQYRHWIEVNEPLEAAECIRAMERAAVARVHLTGDCDYLAWHYAAGQVVTEVDVLDKLPAPRQWLGFEEMQKLTASTAAEVVKQLEGVLA